MRHKKAYKPGRLDLCQSPEYAAFPLGQYVGEFDGGVVWEPAAGEGRLVKGMEKIFTDQTKIIQTDILTGHDFFTWQPDYWDVLITNPPFSLKFDWIERCYQLGKPWALLLPVETIGAARAQHLFKTCGDVSIIYMDKRINFKMPYKGWNTGGAQFPTAWYTFGMMSEKRAYYTFGWLTAEKRAKYERD